MGLKPILAAIVALSFSYANAAVTNKTSAEAEQIKSPWSFGYYHESYSNAAVTDQDWATWNAISATYQIDESSSITFGEAFEYTWNQAGSLQQSDIYTNYSKSFSDMPGDLTAGTKYRLYLPTSAASNEIGRYQFRFYGNIGGKINPMVSWKLETNPRVYGYSKDGSGQVGLKFKNYANFGITPNDYVNFGFTFGHIHYNRNGGISNLDSDLPYYLLDDPYDYDDSLFIELAATLNTGPFSWTVFAEQERDLRASSSTSFLNADETTLFLIMNVSI